MAVVKALRRRGIGERLLTAAVEQAQGLGMQRLFLNAQTQAEGFYRAGGFLPVGDVFMEAGIPHRRMELDLTQLFAEIRILLAYCLRTT